MLLQIYYYQVIHLIIVELLSSIHIIANKNIIFIILQRGISYEYHRHIIAKNNIIFILFPREISYYCQEEHYIYILLPRVTTYTYRC